MLQKLAPAALCTLIMLLAVTAQTRAASPAVTTIVVDNMHCTACAKKIAAKLYGVPGVIDIRTSVPDNTAWVTPQRLKQPSPRAMWEAVEKAGFKPLKLDGPQGKFVSKPQS